MDTESTRNDSIPAGNGGMISEDERREILEEIEESVRVKREPLAPTSARGSNGAALPLAVNIGALILVALTVFLVPGFYNISERRLVDPEMETAGGAVEFFRALRHEADLEIQEQEQTIETLQQQYVQVKAEREALRKDFDRQLQGRADELETGLKATLDAERARLAASGQTEAASQARLAELQATLQAERSRELEAFSVRLQEEADKRDKELSDTQARFNDELRQRTEPLKAEIERLSSIDASQRLASQDLARRYESLRRESAAKQAELIAETETLRLQLYEAKAIAKRLEPQQDARRTLLERLEILARSYASAPIGSGHQAMEQATMLMLLQAKVDTRALLAAEPLRSSHPGLAERLDEYFRNYEN
ncbi:MAG: hypothetical protein E4H20_11875, partial [Spirochaetales bacterium]